MEENKTSKAEESAHWSKEKEVVKSNRPVRFLFFLVRILPVWLLVLFTVPVSFFYYICSPRARKVSRIYQDKLISFAKSSGCQSPIPKQSAFTQIFSFALCIVEKVESWCGNIDYSDVGFADDDGKELKQRLSSGKGAFLLFSHLGNMEYLRSLATANEIGVTRKIPVCIMMDNHVTNIFNQTVMEKNPDAVMNVIDSSDVGIQTIEKMQNIVEQGGIVVVAADRTSAMSQSRNIETSFLGENALFPYGSFLLASLLEVPVYFTFALRNRTFMMNPKYTMHIVKSSVSFSNLKKSERKVKIQELCKEFAAHLETLCINNPFQWYNFYDFWRKEVTCE